MEREFRSSNQAVAKIKDVLNLNNYELKNLDEKECVKELCVAKLCNVLGIKCVYNYKSNFFRLFSEVFGQILCDELKLNINIAEDKLRLFKHDGINLIVEAKKIFKFDELDSISFEESILDLFNYLNQFKDKL